MTTRLAPANPIAPFVPVNGIPIALYPSDPSYSYEIQRAPDVAGAPGAYATIATDIPGNQQVYIDPLPLDDATRWYRVRCSGLGDTASSYIGPISSKPVLLPANVVRPAPVLPTYQDQLTDNGTTGTLTEVVTDPQWRLVSIVAATQTGQAAKSVYAGMTAVGGGVYTQTVTLSETMTATIWVKTTAYDIDGVSKVIRDEPQVFRDSNKPAPPDVLPTIDDSGNVTARLHGDSKTLAFRWVAADNSIPGSPAAGTVVAGRDVVTGTMVTIALGHYAGITVVATQNADGSGAQSIVVTKQMQRQNKSTAKTILINWPWFHPANDATVFSKNAGVEVDSGDVNNNVMFALVDVPPGSTITGFSGELYSAAVGDAVSLKLYKFVAAGSAPTQIGSTLTATQGSGYGAYSSSFSEAAGTAPYHLKLEWTAATTGLGGAGLTAATITYTSPDFTVSR